MEQGNTPKIKHHLTAKHINLLPETATNASNIVGKNLRLITCSPMKTMHSTVSYETTTNRNYEAQWHF